MDYNAVFKEKLNKLLFLEVDFEGFKKNVHLPQSLKHKCKDLYMPISSEYVAKNANNKLMINNLPIYYFIEGMLIALGADRQLSYCEDYIVILNNISESEECGKSLVANRIKEEKYTDAYLLVKGLFLFTGNEEYYNKLLLIGEKLTEDDKGFKDFLLADIEEGKKEFVNNPEPYLYHAILLRNEGDFAGANVQIHEYINKGGEVTKEIEQMTIDIEHIAEYDKAVEELETKPEKSIKTFLSLIDVFDKNPLLYYYLAVGYRNLQNHEKAIYYLNESLSIESGILEVVNELGINYACLGKYEEALKYFRKAFEASRDVEICTNIVMCYMNLGDLEQAKLHLEIAKKLKPDDEIVKQLEEMLKK